MKIIGHSSAPVKRSGPRIPGRKTSRSNAGAVRLNVPFLSGGFPAVDSALASAQRAWSSVPGATIQLGNRNEPAPCSWDNRPVQ